MRLSIFTAFILFFTSFTVMAIEEPEFISIEKKDAFEVREYQPKLIAQVLVTGTFDSASSKGFRLLADFIFGNNKTNEGSKKIDMTAPVVTRDASEKIDMTAPVVSEETERGWYISFNMPKQYTKETLPVPNNPDVTSRLKTLAGNMSSGGRRTKGLTLFKYCPPALFKLL